MRVIVCTTLVWLGQLEDDSQITLMTRTMRDFMGLDDVDDGKSDLRASKRK